MAIPSDAASKIWDNDNSPKNVIIQSHDGIKFNVSISEAKGKHFFFHGWSNVVKHLQLKKGCLDIPESILANYFDYTADDIISIIDVGNKIFHAKIQTLFGKVGFSIGFDVIVTLFHLEPGCYLIFTRGFGNYFHLRILRKNGVEINYSDVQLDETIVAPIDVLDEPDNDEQNNVRVYKFHRMASKDFVSFNIIL
ncbi:putative DNA-binding pseudobarrel domain superfamily [Helianthus debilis subsp. tardiflorus]